MLIKTIKEALNKWKCLPCSCIGRFNGVRAINSPQADTDSLHVIPVTIPRRHSVDTGKR